MEPTHEAKHLSDEQLLCEVHRLVRASNALTAELLDHLVEVERRNLHLREGCSSMFGYCTVVLHMDEGAA